MALRISSRRAACCRLPVTAFNVLSFACSLKSSRDPSPGLSFAAPRRPFISLPTSEPQRLTANRTLPYPSDSLYDLIADVDSYSSFVPYCSRSRVTCWSDPDPNTGRKYPVLADLHVGWGGFDEVFTSRLRCIPGKSVEATSGETALGGSGREASTVFRSLVTRWSVRPLKGPPTPLSEIYLSIDYQFTNPLYGAVSAAVSDKIAAIMVEAFEKRAHEKLGKPQSATHRPGFLP